MAAIFKRQKGMVEVSEEQSEGGREEAGGEGGRRRTL